MLHGYAAIAGSKAAAAHPFGATSIHLSRRPSPPRSLATIGRPSSTELPFDIVKIDLSLVQEAARNTATWAVLRSLRDFARRQNAIVIGEGVETPEQVEALRQLDIDIGQGFLLGKPQALSTLGPHDRASLNTGGLSPDHGTASPSDGVPSLGVVPILDGPSTLGGRLELDTPPRPMSGRGRGLILQPLQPRTVAITPHW